MDSDESQDTSSGNDSEIETYSTNSRDKQFTKKRSPSTKSSQSSRSRSRSSEAQSLKSSDNERSNPQSPSSVDNEEDNERKPQTPKSPESNVQSPRSPNRVQTPSPERNQTSSANSSRSNSPQPHLANNHRSPRPNGNNEDSQSGKSDSSQNSRKSKVSQDKDSNSSDESVASRRSRDAHKLANLDDGHTSDSSTSSEGSNSSKTKKPSAQQEDASDGDVSEREGRVKESQTEENKRTASANINITHEDLSDVSDLEDSVDHSDDGTQKDSDDAVSDSQEKRKKIIERSTQREDVEEQLDFEAEDGECAENDNLKEKDDRDKNSEQELGELDDEGKIEKKDELEEGELTDEEDARPEETEPRPVCRFFSRGQCTWGASCRFLHPGVTDKGNYTMFDLVRPVVPGDYGGERMVYSGRSDPPQIESAWERGLRTAKEMMRKSIKRKEQDIDFEEKKMNLSLAQEEFDKENGYYAKAPSPEPSRYVTMRPAEYSSRAPHDEYYGRRQVVYEPDYVQYSRERVRTYREVPAYRQPEYYSKHEEDPQSVHPKVKRPKREVIVQRAEERVSGRGDEWSDPWMRSKSPAGRKSGRRQSYSSGSSYSSSSSSRSSSGSSKSSYKSRTRRKRSSSRTHRRQVSPSVIVSERKAANERAALMNPPAPRKRAPSPGMMRVGAQNPPAPSKFDQFGRSRTKLVAALARVKGHSSRSSSGSSSGSSSSDSESSASSSSSSKNASPPRRPTGVDLAIALKAKAIDALKSGTEKRQIKLNLKGTPGNKKAELTELPRKPEAPQGKKRVTISPQPADRDPKNANNKKASSRREELLKQLKAVEDAIAKKRSKPN
ncbi:zinc finger CCCH domain-containing protein 18 isoform X1 [Photinus pyralis]|uniref:zinc finger CCCH domain-containing protein 18 isoform X1 n=1 Tax=Photinus pyralis TaxID=7054 RepID=UPI0012671749|nr:zinc finger CCCH domain-containing protein 18 isoform X1 [Photinus pyralis]XP_031346348.1 zinc finger CCCH domain-containing protein 18 isoform X1 [Photinus pyralis]XP_031346349.1 zinc finger CCCH domain-containing protein 18 isoform X1 [Photinus pyralis]